MITTNKCEIQTTPFLNVSYKGMKLHPCFAIASVLYRKTLIHHTICFLHNCTFIDCSKCILMQLEQAAGNKTEKIMTNL